MNYKEGKFHQRHKKSYDNVELIPKDGQIMERPGSHLKMQKGLRNTESNIKVTERQKRHSFAFQDPHRHEFQQTEKENGPYQDNNPGLFRGIMNKIFTPKRQKNA